MPTRRDEVLDAAIAVLAERGGRGLTHRAVDKKAGLPLGSSSNCFRTRQALLAGIAARLAEREQREFGPLGTIRAVSVAELAQFTAAWLAHATDAGSEVTRARLALFLEAGTEPGLAEPLEQMRRAMLTWISGLLEPFADDPDHAALMLSNWAEGVMLHKLCLPGAPVGDSTADVEHAIASAISSR